MTPSKELLRRLGWPEPGTEQQGNAGGGETIRAVPRPASQLPASQPMQLNFPQPPPVVDQQPSRMTLALPPRRSMTVPAAPEAAPLSPPISDASTATTATAQTPLYLRRASRTATTSTKKAKADKGGGILSRLRNITRKERASLSQVEVDELPPLQPPTILSPVEGSAAPIPNDTSDAAGSSWADKMWKGDGDTAPATLVPADEALQLRAAFANNEPPVVGDAIVSRPYSIHSAQASLVDDASTYQGSILGVDEDEEEDDDEDEQGSAIRILAGEVDEDDDHDDEVKASRILAKGRRSGSIPGAFVTAAGFGSDEEEEEETMDTAATRLSNGGSGHDEDGEAQREAFRQALSRQPTEATHTPVASGLVPPAAIAEDAATPKGHQIEATSYFDSMDQVAQALPEVKRGTKAVAATAAAEDEPVRPWLAESGLPKPDVDCLVRQMVAEELQWELDRAWLWDGSQDEATVLGKDDLSIFKRGAFESGLPRPRLPLLDFLFTSALKPLPLLKVPIYHGSAHTFVDRTLLPIVKLGRSLSLSAAVDRHGEGFGAPYNVTSLAGSLRSALFDVSARYLASVLRVAGSSITEPSSSRPPPLPVAFYYSHRKPVSALKQGGFEIDVCSLRAKSSRECDFVLSVRRFGHPVQYVVRDENDLFEFARGLAAELGPAARVRPLPPIVDVASDETMSQAVALQIGAALSRAESRQSVMSPPLPSLSSFGVAPSRSTVSLRQPVVAPAMGKDGSGSSSSGGHSSAAAPGPSRPRIPRLNSYDVAGGSTSNGRLGGLSGASASQLSVSSARPGRNESALFNLHATGGGGAANRISPRASSTTLNTDAGTTVDGRSRKARSRLFGTTKSPNSSRPSSPSKPNSMVAGDASSMPVAPQHELRRQQIRAWLRDAFACRGAGHSTEARAFLSIASFSDKEMRPGTKADMELRAKIDAEIQRERLGAAEGASEDIVELGAELDAMWRDCTTGDGFLKMHEALHLSPTFSSLGLTYQRAISAANLHLAQWLFTTFICGHRGAQNLAQLQEVLLAVPWRRLSFALREPTGLAARHMKTVLSSDEFLARCLGAALEDRPSDDGQSSPTDRELAELRRRLGTPVMRKLQGFVDSSDFKKRLIRQSAIAAGVPLVAAITRGSDAPRLSGQALQKIIAATKEYQDFMRGRPTATELVLKVRANRQVGLIVDMQRMLQILSQRSDGAKVRQAVEDPECRALISQLLDPLLTAIEQVRDADEARDLVDGIRSFLERLIDCLVGLRARVQEPWRSISTIASLLDDAVPAWYARMHALAQPRKGQRTTLAYDTFEWLHGLAKLAGRGSSDLDSFWSAPRQREPSLASAAAAGPKGRASANGAHSSEVPVDEAVLSRISQLRKAKEDAELHSFQMASRWAAGDVDAGLPIQLVGEGGRTRTLPVKADLPAHAEPSSALHRFAPGFRAACAKVLDALVGSTSAHPSPEVDAGEASASPEALGWRSLA